MKDPTTIGNYELIKEIGKGSFGTVYEAKNTSTHEIVALKLEESTIDKSQLQNEFAVYESLRGTQGVPMIYYYGKHNCTYYITMKKLDVSLAEIHSQSKKFSLKTVCMIAKRIIKILKAIHGKEYVYRDMKPENILTYKDEIFLIDFGMCKKYIKDGKHIKMVDNKVLTGTARYASVNTHKGYEQSRRDDLEGLGYVLIFLLKGDLPWMGIPAPTRKEKYAKIGESKNKTTSEDLCNGLPGSETFVKYFNIVKKLKFTDEPDYSGLIKLFDNCLKKNHVKDDNVFDWVIRPPDETQNKQGIWRNLKMFFKDL
ncbi:hypothetical protein GVAV_001891 [Gurleya vavrai]